MNKNAEYLDSRDENYAIGWYRHDTDMENGRVYIQAAEMMQPTSGVHLDIGSGIGTFIYRQKEQNPNLTVIGVDNNRYMLEGSRRILERNGVPVLVASRILDRILQDGRVLQMFRRIKKVRPRQILKKGQVSLVADDVRQMSVMNEILDKRKIDSASFMFPGGSPRLSLEKRGSFEGITDQQLMDEQQKIMQKIRKVVGEYLTGNVKKGGRVLLAERVGVFAPREVELVAQETARMVFQNLADSWTLENASNFLVSGQIAPTRDVEGRSSHSFNLDSGIELATSVVVPDDLKMVLALSLWKRK